MDELKQLGFDDWFRNQLDVDLNAAHDIARIISVHRDSYVVTKGQGEAIAELAGNLYYATDTALQLPTTGDWVYADFYDDDTHAIIHGLIPRKTLLKRKTAGKSVDFQLVAANIDTAFIVQSLDYNFNLSRLERYLVMVNESGIKPVILFSKCDLVCSVEREEKLSGISAIAAQARIIPFSNMNGENIDVIIGLLLPAHTYCLLGSSGVGKTTLLNRIMGCDQFQTQSVSKKENKGRHTTTSRELVRLDNGALIIDTPGMRELGNLAADVGLDQTFAEIIELARHCKFSNCSHTREKGCAILAAIENGELAEKRFRNFLKMKNESAFNKMSYVEKRKKDRNFGKMIKAIMKDKKKR